MIFDIEMLRKHYSNLPQKIAAIKQKINKPLTATEKILYSHLFNLDEIQEFKRGVDYVDFAPDSLRYKGSRF